MGVNSKADVDVAATSEPGATVQPRAGSASRGSTGPRTQLGKDHSKQNALTHGIFSKEVVLKRESRTEFDALLSGLRDDFQPVGTFEEGLVEILAVTWWRQRRLLRAEGAEIQAGREGESLLLMQLDGSPTELAPLRRSVPDSPRLEQLLRYGTALERTFERALNQLERAQRIRLGQPVAPRIDLNISSS
jgi:hypothetical protein